MKNILKIIILTFSIVCFYSCENEKDPVVSSIPFELRTLETLNPIILLPENVTNTVLTLEWDKSDVNVNTLEPKYIIEIAKANTNFQNALSVNGDEFITTDRTYVLKVEELNSLLFNNGFVCGVAEDIDIRVKSILGNREGNPLLQYSNVVKINVTPFTTQLPQLAFAQNTSEISNSIKLASSSVLNSDYEGYMYLQPGNYKLYRPDACNSFTTPVIYGGTTGNIDATPTAPSIVVATAGHYLIKADLTANTYSVKEYTTFGIFGQATRPSLFNNQVPMTYDDVTKVWKLTVDLRKGYKFKFKSNLWTGALVVPALPNPPYAPGTALASSLVSILGKSAEGELVENSTSASGEITVPGATTDDTRQKYDIELNVSNPRKYTYKFTINPN